MRALFHTVNRRDVRMIQRGQHLRFACEAGHTVGIVRERLRQHLDRDLAVQLGVGGAIHRAHPAFTELGRDAIVRNGWLRGHVGEIIS